MAIPLTIPSIIEEDIENAVKVLRSGQLVYGAVGKQFEESLKKFFNVQHAFLLSNGTATLHLSLLAAGIGPGDKVVVPAFSYVASANVIELVGATPVFIDIDIDNLNIDVHRLDEIVVDPAVRAIMPVHEFGMPVNMDAILAFAKKHQLVVIEDAACAFGAKYKDAFVGTIGNFGSFSFHPRKSITSGEGGLLVVQHPEHAEVVNQLRNHGISYNQGKMEFVNAGFNYRMTDFQAALLQHQLMRFSDMLESRSLLAAFYDEHLNHPAVTKPYQQADRTIYLPGWQSYHIILDQKIDRDAVKNAMIAEGIGCNYGAQCIPAEPYYHNKYKLNAAEEFPNAWTANRQGLVLPLYDSLSIAEATHVVSTLTNVLNRL